MTVIQVASNPVYSVHIGAGACAELAEFADDSRRIAVIADESLDLRPILAQLDPSLVVKVPAGESAKNITVVSQAWDRLGEHGFTRSDLIISVGGGATTDVAGFIAATWLRGIDVVHVPTTVLAMVDAAVGGKTGIDTGHGKNLVGSFHQPQAVIADTMWLETLSLEQRSSGLAEIVKCGFISDPSILDEIESASFDPMGNLENLIVKGIAVKAAHVVGDERERTTAAGERVLREALNYGHTLGHAIERHSDYTVSHGNAISVGMVFAAELARLAGFIDADLVARHREVLTRIGQGITYRADAFDDMRTMMSLDKKTRGSTLRFIVLDTLGSTRVLSGPSEDQLREAYQAVHAR